jgi:hypothetical protein
VAVFNIPRELKRQGMRITGVEKYQMSAELCQERPREIQDAIDGVAKIGQHCRNRLSRENPRLIERYIEGELHILVRFLVNGTDVEYIADFQRAEDIGDSETKVTQRLNVSISQRRLRLPELARENRSDANADIRGPDRYQQAVLVGVVKLFDSPERVVSSLVRFGCVDEINRILPHEFYFSGRVGHIVRGTIIDRVGDTVRNPLCAASAHEIELLRQMIQGSPKITEHVANHQADVCRDSINPRHVAEQLARLRIVLGPDFIRLGAIEGFDGSLEIVEVEFGPLGLQPWSG